MMVGQRVTGHGSTILDGSREFRIFHLRVRQCQLLTETVTTDSLQYRTAQQGGELY